MINTFSFSASEQEDSLQVDDMGDGMIVMTGEEGRVAVSITQLRAAMALLNVRYAGYGE